ncbi:MAG TPA: hypothetical protein VN788_03655 [Verrucomicrobiae bacterium]|nr:hypothetical protein [Verrucomicrobiae bacterium]
MSVIRLAEAIQPRFEKTAEAVSVRFQPALMRGAVFTLGVASLVAYLLRPLALAAAALGVWRLSADLGWTDAFFITHGLFSHFQVWFALAIGLHFVTVALDRSVRPAAQQPPAEQS